MTTMQATIDHACRRFLPLLPELFAARHAAFALLMLDLFLDERRGWCTHLLAVATLVLVAAMLAGRRPAGSGAVLGGMFIRDNMGDVLKLFGLPASPPSPSCTRWPFLRDARLFKGEFYTLMLFAVLGMMLLVSAGSLVTVYLGLELLALCSYALVAIDRDSPLASEAAMKYFVLGALASGMLLYGMSMLYGATGSSIWPDRRAPPRATNRRSRCCLRRGVHRRRHRFKFGAAPFHMWVPDVYQGAPTAITLFIGSAPKLAAFGMAIRLLAEGMGPLVRALAQMLAILACCRWCVGNLVAIAQTNLKRMLAYSTISHVGFLCWAWPVVRRDRYAAAMFYAISYALMTTGAFGAIILLSRRLRSRPHRRFQGPEPARPVDRLPDAAA
jgi:NADH-quinone oxidoreductase subunit N